MTDQAVVDFLQSGQPECPGCGHGLGGLKAPVCPECGARLVLRLGTSSTPGLVIPAAWVLWWNVLAGLLYVAYQGWTTWQMFEPAAKMAKSLNQPFQSFPAFWFEANLSLSGVFVACNLAGVVVGGRCLVLLRMRSTNRRVSRWIVIFCAVSLAVSVLLQAIAFLD